VLFIEGFYLFIHENYPYTHNTAMKFVQRFRTVVLFARNLGLINFNPFGAYKLKFEYVKRGYLEQDELDRIYQKVIIYDITINFVMINFPSYEVVT
jgi:hypothetical protein